MNAPSNLQRLWFYRIFSLLVTALLVHVLVIWAAPRLIMRAVINGVTTQHTDAPTFPPPVTASARSIVMPSPDLLYSVCVYDVSDSPVRVTADPQLTTYWSIALYAANSDNFFVINDRQAANKPVDLWLVSEGGNPSQQGAPAGSTVVVSPTSKGFLLMRVLTGNYEAEKNRVEPARRTLSCRKTGGI